MARKSADASRPSSKRSTASKRSIPEPFQMVRAATMPADDKSVKVPMLVLRGEWLRKCGFPIDSAAYLTLDAQGEITVHRLGLRVPRRIRIRSARD